MPLFLYSYAGDYVEVLDTTLRDGSQGASVSFTLQDKIRVALKLDELGVDYIEGGWPYSNPKDYDFFKAMREYSLTRAKLAAFGSTRRKNVRPKDDESLNSIVKADVPVAVIFGKSWTLHVEKVLETTWEENLSMIAESVEYLREHGMEVVYDAEHFYQGYQEDPEAALASIEAAWRAGARVVVLADTNGGTPPHEVYRITAEVRRRFPAMALGAHMHNDIGCAVANTLMAVAAGARHVQGTVNGVGERTGNADLTAVLPTLELKMGFRVLRDEPPPVKYSRLREVSRLVYEALGAQPNPYQPYIGEFAFAHKGGVHADAVMKVPRAYEHIDPALVGNRRVFVVSEVAGGASVVVKAAEELGIPLDKRHDAVRKALEEIKRLEREGYSFDLAPASALLILMRHLGLYRERFRVVEWRVVTGPGEAAYAIVKVWVDGEERLEAGEGVGPVHAIDVALRRALTVSFPELRPVALRDYRVVLPSSVKSTESIVRVTVEFGNGDRIWRTVGVSSNIVMASIKALVDGYDFALQTKELKTRAVENTWRRP
ncbi:citramalate synthase [Pyrobaculum neutrophilum]|uniref:Citramalate synthase n=1 Tax=Pyrobaculum neutrophilum (strain DSM 2338 / JCM 9278 / NBRC 100436 / V24Sta) TaxID=444157 RepID=B1YBE0_PYRNV|nr:citramalate synthase [Pyrobaculum neutrophilum]ACB39271.1 2-isopropylmalate synthase/homocitrate synthase family protein [Pyrobaculum neutrophilum V24Sta]